MDVTARSNISWTSRHMCETSTIWYYLSGRWHIYLMDIMAHLWNEQTLVLIVWPTTYTSWTSRRMCETSRAWYSWCGQQHILHGHHGACVKRTEFGIPGVAEDIVHGHHGTCVKRVEFGITCLAEVINTSWTSRHMCETSRPDYYWPDYYWSWQRHCSWTSRHLCDSSRLWYQVVRILQVLLRITKVK